MPPAPSALSRFFAWIIARRWLVLALYAVLLPPAAFYASKVGQDNSIDRLIVPTDPDYLATRDFEKVFGGGEYAVLVAEAPDPFAPAVVERFDKLEQAIGKVPGIDINSVLSIYRRAKAGFTPGPEQAEAFRKFATGTDLFRKQGLVGDHFLAMAVVLDVKGREDRAAKLAAIDRAIAEAGGDGPPLARLDKIGTPYVNVYLDDATGRAGPRYFGLFGVFVVVLNLALYRSARALVAFLATLGVCLAVSLAFVGVTGGTFTIVSPMVPMTILITATASLVYLHSRFVDRPADRPVEEHRIFALTNKFVAVTASIFATLVGFAALAVSTIRPIREMGIWVAVGLLLTWIVVFTLFPALQKIVAAPTSQEKAVAAGWFLRFTEVLPRLTYRLRWPLVLGSLALCAAGGVALFGIKGAVPPMRLLTTPVEYINPDTELYRATKRLEPSLPGLNITEVWLKGKLGTISEPEVLTALHGFQQSLEQDPDVGAAVGVTTILRVTRYIAGQGDAWPKDPAEVDQLAGDLEGLLPKEPTLQRFVDKSAAQTHLAIITRATEYEAFQKLDARIQQKWEEAVQRTPKLKELEMRSVGLGRLQAKMSQNLVPTLLESFWLTVVIIFSVFLVIFRSGAARIMTMIPSFFAILVMFLVMRLAGMQLNVATILIASTVLGTSENDQIHFFYHFLEKRKEGTVEESLRHTLLVSGKAIFFATLINAGGFLAFALAELPPMRQFGILTAVALVMSMVADFTALPAALWLVFRTKPDPKP